MIPRHVTTPANADTGEYCQAPETIDLRREYGNIACVRLKRPIVVQDEASGRSWSIIFRAVLYGLAAVRHVGLLRKTQLVVR